MFNQMSDHKFKHRKVKVVLIFAIEDLTGELATSVGKMNKNYGF